MPFRPKENELCPNKHDYCGGFKNEGDIHLMNIKSIEFLNSKMKPEDHVSYMKFKPNIVIDEELIPFEEDRYREMRLGNAMFRMTDFCARCKSTSMKNH